MNDKHTPGPWHIDDLTIFDESKNKHSGTFDIKTIEGCEGPFKVVCSVNAYGGSYFLNRDEARVNAKLIAVAPDMIIELQDTHEHLLRIYSAINGRSMNCEVILQDLRDRMAKQRILIDKATT